MFTDDLEGTGDQYQNKLYGWANKKRGSRWNSPRWKKRSNTGEGCLPLPLPLLAEVIAEEKAIIKKTPSQIAAQLAVEIGVVKGWRFEGWRVEKRLKGLRKG